MKHRRMTANAGGSQLLLAAGQAGSDAEQRTISGIVVPYGKVGETSAGRLTFSRGSLKITDPKRIKLLREHSQDGDVLGHGLEFEERDDGLHGTFRVAATEAGDQALLEVREGLRDGFSVGVALDDKTVTHLRRSQGTGAVAAAGTLRETSLVSVPAFDDARTAARADLVVSSWSDASSSSAGQAGSTGGDTTMTDAQKRRLAELLGRKAAGQQLNTEDAGELTQLQALAQQEGIDVTPTPVPGEQPTPPAGDTGTGASAGAGPLATAGTVPAVAGAALVTSQPATYDFSERGGLMRDLFRGAVMRDAEAAERTERFNAELRDENPASVLAFVRAAATREDIDGAGTDLPPSWGGGTRFRPDMMRQLADVRRPFIARLNTVPLTDAQPFAIPTVGEFTGVGDHTEGTPHRPAGTLTLGVGGTVQPRAVSGAWEVSRELLDAANPVLDRIAVRAMMRDYQRQSEGRLIALFDALAAVAGANIYGVDGVMALRAVLLDFVNDDEEAADLVALSKGLLGIMLNELDADDRPQLPFIGPVNAVGTARAGYTGVAIDGVEMFRAARLDAGVSAAGVTAGSVGVIARSEGILWGESRVQQFRFDEVLGPGVVKFALWAYNAAAILDTDDIAILNSGADPTP